MVDIIIPVHVQWWWHPDHRGPLVQTPSDWDMYKS